MIQVVKRDGEVAEFSLNKITEAIKRHSGQHPKITTMRFWSYYP